MRYLKNELKKINKSKLSQILLALVLIYSVVIYSTYLYILDNQQSFLTFFLESFRKMTTIPIFNIISIALSSLLVAREYQDRTMMYVYIRPAKTYKLFFSKFIAVMLYSCFIVLIVFLLTLFIGCLFFEYIPFYFDTNIGDSMLRCLIYLLYTFVGLLISTSLSFLICVIVRNQVGSALISILLFTFFSIANWEFSLWGKSYSFPMSTYMDPSIYFNLDLNSFISRCGKFTLLNLLVISIFIFISYIISLQIRTEEKILRRKK